MQGAVELQEFVLADDVAVPVQHDTSLEARGIERQGSHGVGMVDVDDIVAVADLHQCGHHRGCNHRGLCLQDGAADVDVAVLVELYVFYVPVLAGEHGVAVNATLRQTFSEGVHDFLHATFQGVEFPELKYSHKLLINRHREIPGFIDSLFRDSFQDDFAPGAGYGRQGLMDGNRMKEGSIVVQ